MTVAALAWPRDVGTIAPTRSTDGAPPSPPPPELGRPSIAAQSAPQRSLLAPRLLIELDQGSGRFVQTLIDPSSETVLRRYPDEGQLAFSRGVSAYMRALLGVQ